MKALYAMRFADEWKSGYLSTQNYSSFWPLIPSDLCSVLIIKGKNLFIPADKTLYAMLFQKFFIGENLYIFLSRTMVLSGDWFLLIFIKYLFKGKTLFNAADKNGLCNVFSEILSVKSGYLYIQELQFFLRPGSIWSVFSLFSRARIFLILRT